VSKLEWHEKTVQRLATIECGTSRLALIYGGGITSGPFSVNAVETDMLLGFAGRSAAEGHKYKDVGEFKTEKAAIAACEKYAKAWLKKRKREERCACTDIHDEIPYG
jgi:hypothetical protein